MVFFQLPVGRRSITISIQEVDRDDATIAFASPSGIISSSLTIPQFWAFRCQQDTG
tara:strand:+ start:976 stop:1143 length:168 start_codon:yes stop_codon:yes gene_type:complete